MFQMEANAAGKELERGAIRFKRKGGGYWYPDRTIDRNMIELCKVQYRVTKDPDAVIWQFSGIAWLELV